MKETVGSMNLLQFFTLFTKNSKYLYIYIYTVLHHICDFVLFLSATVHPVHVYGIVIIHQPKKWEKNI